MKALLQSLTRLLAVVSLLLALFVVPARASVGDYPLGSGDLIQISVSGYPELGVNVRVSQSGNISFPYLGQLPVAGRSPAEVEALLTQRLIDGAIVPKPQVSVLVVDFQSQVVAVMGQVNKPGQYPLQIPRKLIDMLAEAGGVVNDAAGDQATLLRRDGSKVTIDLQTLFDGDSKENLVVAGGDTIYVPRAPQFYVYGEVQKPGMYRLERDMTVSRAISTGGGLTPRGSERRVIVKRRDANGKENELSVRGSDLVEANDVLMIKESLF